LTPVKPGAHSVHGLREVLILYLPRWHRMQWCGAPSGPLRLRYPGSQWQASRPSSRLMERDWFWHTLHTHGPLCPARSSRNCGKQSTHISTCVLP